MLAPFWAGVSSEDIMLGSFASLSGALVATSSSAILSVKDVEAEWSDAGGSSRDTVSSCLALLVLPRIYGGH